VSMTRIGQYEILGKIASGGMGIVYRAIHTPLHREVALKVLLPDLADDVNALARFQREAQSASKLRHPNIIEVYDLGQADGQNYMAMEYLPEGSLQQKLREMVLEDTAALTEEQVLRMTRPLADALGYAHEQGLVHRDIKPSNILLRGDGTPVLADFGIVLATTATRLTRNLSAIGTPDYMSPEQGKGGAVDGRSDLYSLGIVMYEMLEGEPPFKADTPVAVVYKHIKDPLPEIRRKDVSLRTRRIIEKVTAKEPNDRYQTGAELIKAIDLALDDLQRGAVTRKGVSVAMPAAIEPVTALTPAGTDPIQPSNRLRRRNLILGLVAAVALALLIGGSVVIINAISSNTTQQGTLGTATAPSTGARQQLTATAAELTVSPTDAATLAVIATSATTVEPTAATSPTPSDTAIPPTSLPTNTPLPSGSCLPGYVYRLARPADKICVPPASRNQAQADNSAAASRRAVATNGPDTCKAGYVFRLAFNNDHVCVTQAVRNQVQADNAAAASRKLLQYGPDTCILGYVWREAYPNDHVCVTGATRAQAQADNAAAASRIDPGGAYGPNSCVAGYVWREARTEDYVCVTAVIRSQTAGDNAAAASRQVVASDGPDTCKDGFVWRLASSSDHVCVTSDIQAQAQADNSAAASRKLLQQGPDTCINAGGGASGSYVWRLAFPGDHVCVSADVAAAVKKDNNLAPSRTAP